MAANFILSLVVILLSVVILIQTASYPDFGNLSVIGPEAIPNCLAYFMLAAAAYLITAEVVKCLRGKKENPSYFVQEINKAKAVLSGLSQNLAGVVRTILTLVLMYLFATCLKKVGFEICSAVFLIGTMLLNGVRKIWKLITVPVVTIAVVYLVFVYGLRVNIPMMFLG